MLCLNEELNIDNHQPFGSLFRQLQGKIEKWVRVQFLIDSVLQKLQLHFYQMKF